MSGFTSYHVHQKHVFQEAHVLPALDRLTDKQKDKHIDRDRLWRNDPWVPHADDTQKRLQLSLLEPINNNKILKQKKTSAQEHLSAGFNRTDFL